MVFFNCEQCNETLKKNQVEKHTYKCRSQRFSCIDCGVVFHGDEYAVHTSCISEAEKYEKSLYKGKAKKLNPQDLWIALVEEAASDSGKAPTAIQAYLKRLGDLGNVPRNNKKFVNFVKNSLKIQNEHLIGEIWTYLEKLRVERTKEQGDAAEQGQVSAVAAVASSSSKVQAEEIVETEEVEVVLNEEERLEKKRLKKLRKEAKKRKREEAERASTEAQAQPEIEVEPEAEAEVEAERSEKKQKKEKKAKKSRDE